MKKQIIILMLTLLSFQILQAQVETDSLTLQWEATVNYGSFGQTTVLVNDTLWHFGGRFYYGTPFGHAHYDQSFVEHRALSDGNWTVDSVTTRYRYYGNAKTFNGKIYLLGGGGSETTSLEIFDPATRSVTEGTPMPANHRNAGAVLYNGKIYVIAGNDNVEVTDRLDIYDIATDSWSTGSAFPIATETEAVLVNDKIYTMGGYDGTVRNEIYEYDIAGDTWTQIGTMPFPTSAHRLALYNNYIYVIGDYADVNRLMRYSVTDSSWVNYESNFIGRRHASVVIADNKLHIIAGNSNKNGSWQFYGIDQSIDLTDVVSVSRRETFSPQKNTLAQNFPNPFNPTTSIRFLLHEPSTVQLNIYNINGQLVRQLADSKFNPGEQEIVWDGKDNHGQALASGQYLYSLKTDRGIIAKKMIMLR